MALDREQVVTLLTKYALGTPAGPISKEIGCSFPTVTGQARRYGIEQGCMSDLSESKARAKIAQIVGDEIVQTRPNRRKKGEKTIPPDQVKQRPANPNTPASSQVIVLPSANMGGMQVEGDFEGEVVQGNIEDAKQWMKESILIRQRKKNIIQKQLSTVLESFDDHQEKIKKLKEDEDPNAMTKALVQEAQTYATLAQGMKYLKQAQETIENAFSGDKKAFELIYHYNLDKLIDESMSEEEQEFQEIASGMSDNEMDEALKQLAAG